MYANFPVVPKHKKRNIMMNNSKMQFLFDMKDTYSL